MATGELALGSELEETEEDEDSTPHILSEPASDTQSPVSAGRGEGRLSGGCQLVEDVEPDSSQEDEVGPGDGGGFNQTKTETTIMEEMALQIELESDKNNIRSEQGLGLDEELLHPDQINAEEEEEGEAGGGEEQDNKITEESLQQAGNRADSRQGELQHSDTARTFYGISLGRIYKLRKQKTAIMCAESDSSPHYRNGDEPEPIELTFLNVEAAMMSLASKVRSLCGKADSPTLSHRTFRFKESVT